MALIYLTLNRVYPRLIGFKDKLRCVKTFKRQLNTRSTLNRKLLPFEVDTNVKTDILLYKYENSRFHRLLSFFAIGQFLFWIYLSHFAYTCLKDAPVKSKINPDDNPDDNPFWRRINFGENKYRFGLTFMCASIGYFIVTGSFLYSFRSVRSMTLLRGGEKVDIVTYKPFALRRSFRVAVNDTTCLRARTDPSPYLALKVKGFYMFFLLDKNGRFVNDSLFDYTAGMKRVF